ncbi:hypothetical protein [Nocardioides litoris]|nr:hypothetical protein [Nocardioides litoris]
MHHPTVPASTSPGRSTVAAHAESAVQRVADASIWLLFRINGVRS